ncbi:MAG: DUF2065 family protein [Pseudomonadota bacterium]
MDLLAALGLVLVIEGLALAIFASSLPELMASMNELRSGGIRRIGLAMVALGAMAYLAVRGTFWAV